MTADLSPEDRAELLGAAMEAIRDRMRSRAMNPQEAHDQLVTKNPWKAFPGGPEILGEARDKIQRIIDETVDPGTTTEPPLIEKSDMWYEGPDFKNDKYWPAVRKALTDKLDQNAIESIDKSSNQIIAYAGMPWSQNLRTRGLVVGFVQSGKTTNFLSVIAKAADVGYRLIVVLAGMTNSLREQTQKRLIDSLVSPTSQKWMLPTDIGRDFTWTNDGRLLLDETNHPQLIVIKKNGSRLNRLNKWLDDIARKQGKLNFPILVIDDEADQASVNVMTSTKEKYRRSAINAQIGNLVNRPRTSYIAYTATPFANILINPNDGSDLYPENFINVLPRPEGYFGAAELFGRDAFIDEDPAEIGDKTLSVIRDIPKEEIDGVRPQSKNIDSWTPKLPDSLRDAVCWFLLATAARWARGQDDQHSSMLVHSSPRIAAHRQLKSSIEAYINQMRNRTEDPELRNEIEELWNRETSIQTQRTEYPVVTFDQVWDNWNQVLQIVQTIKDNGESDRRLDYSEGRQTVIAVGGNTLSRGLTLEGLICSYFVRVSRTYDTLLQMGRWFGFRQGYEDLVRIWMTSSLAEWYKDLATVEEDLRRDLGRYASENLTPAQFQARIRLHDSMQITSAAKMRNSKIESMSFSGSRAQTIVFHEQDRDFLHHNIEVTRNFLFGLREKNRRHWQRESNGSTIFSGLTNQEILQFLSEYKFIEDVEDTPHGNKWELLTQYIEKEAENGGLVSWNVSVFGQQQKPQGTIDLGLEQPVNLVRRTRVNSSTPGRASINTLVGPKDRINDIPFDEDQWRELDREIRENKKTTDAVLIQKHVEYVGSRVGHLTIYAIDGQSAPKHVLTPAEEANVVHAGRIRRSLDAKDHVIALGVFLPETDSDSKVEYRCGIDRVAPAGMSQEEIDEARADQQEIEDIVTREDVADNQDEDSDEN